MRAIVDKDLCTGCGLCTETAPEVFEMEGDVAVVRVNEIPSEAQDAARQAAEECPVEAITIEE
jgi:ferredoxin